MISHRDGPSSSCFPYSRKVVFPLMAMFQSHRNGLLPWRKMFLLLIFVVSHYCSSKIGSVLYFRVQALATQALRGVCVESEFEGHFQLRNPNSPYISELIGRHTQSAEILWNSQMQILAASWLLAGTIKRSATRREFIDIQTIICAAAPDGEGRSLRAFYPLQLVEIPSSLMHRLLRIYLLCRNPVTSPPH
ncbi:unnamed protein product [Nesidiocoris tenuis]|uniref:Uncharacterized protein n=1 Tax=Nesidiocoris tenuis TaxID=355587 RepID=A0A6H5G6E1_9HEMI|nr:unnamed protein product [Nesidiocoris tenuis]